MTGIGFTRDLLRPKDGTDAHRVTFVELFFDLVFIFAVTQISHHLIATGNAVTLLQTVIMTLAVWWVWVDTAWVTNWLNPEKPRVRGLLIAMMLLCLLMGSAIPEAFGDKGVLFAVCLVAVQLARSIFTVLAFARFRADNAVNFVRITIWFSASGVFWIVGAFVPPELRLWLWLLAVAIDSAGPISRFFVPGLKATDTGTWDVTGEHMSERVSLFLLIALGESIVVTGGAFAALPFDATHLIAFGAAFASAVLMWLLFFNHAERSGTEFIADADERGLVARAAYTYVPVIIVLGIVLTAVADGIVLKHASAPLGLWTAGLIGGGSAVYLAGNVLFKRAVGGPWLVTHLAGIAVLLALILAWPVLGTLVMTWLGNAVLLLVVIADEILFRRVRHHSTAAKGS